MRRRVAQLQVSGAAYISSFTEPFLPRLEDHYHITQRLTQVFLDEGLPLFYLSRRIPPDWAVDALQANPYSYMQWSVNTSNNDHYRRMSPGSYTIDEVLTSVQKLNSQGVYTSFQCNPILPGITTLDELKTLVRLGAQAGLRHIIFKFAEQVTGNRKMLLARLGSAGLPGIDVFDRLFDQIVGGVYTIREIVRRFWLDELLAETRANNITMSTCYEYYDNGKGGASLAPYYTTSDQCHGRGIPVYYRPEPSERFQPIAGCYRKGCLYCAEHGTRACNNEILLQAKALDYQTMRKIKVIPTGSWGEVDSCWPPIESQGGGRNMKLMTDAEMWKG